MTPTATSQRHTFWPIYVTAVIFGASAFPHQAEAWTSTLEVGAVQNDNVTNAIKEEKDDFALTAAIDFSNHHNINRDWQVGFGGSLQSSTWQDYTGLNLTEIGVHATLRRKFGLGPYATRIEMRTELAHQFSKVDDWSGNWLRASATLQKRFSPLWQGSLTGEYDQLSAGRAVYSTSNSTATAVVDFDPSPDWRVSLSMLYRHGDQLSWCRNSWRPFIGTVQWKDGIFGGDWFPYQSFGRTTAAGITISRAMGTDSSISLSYDSSDARTTPNHIYLNRIYSLKFIHSF